VSTPQYNPSARSGAHLVPAKESALKKLLVIVFFGASLWCAPANNLSLVNAQEKQFTLEQVMSAPFPSDLSAAPAGGRVAWVLNAKGVRNIWIAEPPAYKGRQITSYSEDDGLEIGELAWTPDGQSIIYTRGGDLEGFGENPNPRSRTEEPKQQIWIVSLEGKLRLLGEGHSAVVSPKGDRVAFILKSDV
jgi:Tol biopolymer transport system component